MKTAIVLFNLGGPDGLEAVKPFLRNLFRDPAILGVPQPVRELLARLISSRRAPVARDIYAQMGGGSPILPNTEAQARELEAELGEGYRCFIAMRYWHPMTDAAVQAVQDWGADQVVLLPLYPQFSTTTSGSSLLAWQKACQRRGFNWPTRTLGCHPVLLGWVEAIRDLIVDNVPDWQNVRLLFSAHGLPQKVVDKGDPYQWQVEQTVAKVVAALGGHADSVVCYQSKVGPLKWLEPATDAEIRRAGQDKRPVAVIPVAFVSEHSETLVELDVEYRHLAKEAGVPAYTRVPTVSVHPAFIAGLAGAIRNLQQLPPGVVDNAAGARLCPAQFGKCICWPE